jgi:uncharacterized protein with FMN-binding domain
LEKNKTGGDPMKKVLSVLLAVLFSILPVLALATGITAEGTYTDGIYQGEAEGFAGALKVEVTIEGGAIKNVKLLETADTEAIYTQAVENVIPAIVAANTVTGIDVQSGATFSSTGIIAAVANALAQAGATVTLPEAKEEEAAGKEPSKVGSGTVYMGFGSVPNFRVGPGKDPTETQVYSFNVTMASVLFDEEGRILDLNVDIYEISTPNYDGASMPHFSGWPGKEGYNVFDHEKEAVTGVSENSEDSVKAEVNGWLTKRERGDSYSMNPQNEWYKQMDTYEAMFTGWTVQEIRDWYGKYTSTRNGRPIKLTSENEDDIKALAAMSEEDKAVLADVTSQATMSLSDAHGLILEAIEEAYANRQPSLTVGE